MAATTSCSLHPPRDQGPIPRISPTLGRHARRVNLQSFVVPMAPKSSTTPETTSRNESNTCRPRVLGYAATLYRRLSEGRAHAQRSKLQAQATSACCGSTTERWTTQGRRARPNVKTRARPGWPASLAAALNALVKLVGGAGLRRADAHLAVVGLARPCSSCRRLGRRRGARRARPRPWADALARVSEALGCGRRSGPTAAPLKRASSREPSIK